MRKYELTYLVSDVIPESDLNKVTGQVSGFVLEQGGTIVKEDIWGRRKLAYPILKQDFATYVTLYFELSADKVIAFERDLKHAGGVVRHLLVVNELGAETLTLSLEDVAATKDIEDVVGGEKSFEAVEGETEESKELMAKRESKEAEQQSGPSASLGINSEAEESPSAESTGDAIAEIVEEMPAEEPTAEVEKELKKQKSGEAEKRSIIEPKTEMKPKKAKKEPIDEAERLNKLNAELDDILKDEL